MELKSYEHGGVKIRYNKSREVKNYKLGGNCMNRAKLASRFMKAMDKHVNDLLNQLDKEGYDEKYDIKLEVNGDKLIVPLNADSYCRLSQFLVGEVLDALEENGKEAILNRMNWFAQLQSYIIELRELESKRWFITFDYHTMRIHNPFMDPTRQLPVNPIEHYGELFIKSDWFTGKFDALVDRIKVVALDFCDAVDANTSFEDAVKMFIDHVNGEDNYYWYTAALLVELATSSNPRIYYDSVKTHGRKAFVHGEYIIV